jgi:4-hydroxybenzoate polyprenyltransferase
MVKLVPLVRACHFQPTLAVTGFATALAVGVDRGWGSIWVAAAALSGQLTVGWSNDYLDRDRDRLVGRTDKPIAAGEVDASLVRRCAIAAAAACIPLSLASGWRAALVHLVAVAFALGYNVRLKATVFSVVPYVVAFGALPAFVVLGAPSHNLPPWPAMLAAALLGAGAHFVNTLPDLDADALTGIDGLPHRLGPTKALLTGVVLLIGATAIVAQAGEAPLSTLSTALAFAAVLSALGVLIGAATGRQRAAWTLSLVTAGITVALFLTRTASLT